MNNDKHAMRETQPNIMGMPPFRIRGSLPARENLPLPIEKARVNGPCGERNEKSYEVAFHSERPLPQCYHSEAITSNGCPWRL